MSNKSYSICLHCCGKGCDKCHQGWECTKFTEEYYRYYPNIKNDHYGTECDFCSRGWKLGAENNETSHP